MTKLLTHLKPNEQRLARFVIETNPFQATAYSFDEHLGNGIPIQEDWPVMVAFMARSLTQRRVDMIAFTPGGEWLIELKERGDAHAIGQLLLYKTLYREKYPDRKIMGLALVAPYLGFDLDPALLQHEIQFIKAPPTP